MRFITGFIIAIMITGVASAQHGNPPAGHVSFGIKGGLNLYNVHNDDNTDYDRKIGYHLGLLGHIHFDSQFAIQPEIVYSTQGAKIGNTKNNLDYINVPVLFQYMFDNGFRIQAGPQVGFLMRATNNKDDYNPIDAGLSIGASYVVPSTGFGIDARYNHGLSNINKSDELKSTNRGFQLGLFYIFGHNARNILN